MDTTMMRDLLMALLGIILAPLFALLVIEWCLGLGPKPEEYDYR